MTRWSSHRADRRLAAAVAVVSAIAVFTSCGGDASDGDETGGSAASSSEAASTPSDTPEEREYFGDAESEALNAAILALDKKRNDATDQATVDKCFALYSEPDAWRECLHDLLDPVAKGYDRLAKTADGTARPELGQKCTDAIGTFSATMRNHATGVEDLVAAFDGDRRADHDAAAAIYHKTVDPSLDKAIIAISKGCYSKETLENLSESAGATDSAKP